MANFIFKLLDKKFHSIVLGTGHAYPEIPVLPQMGAIELGLQDELNRKLNF